MSVSTTPHVNFRGDAREALEFYKRHERKRAEK